MSQTAPRQRSWVQKMREKVADQKQPAKRQPTRKVPEWDVTMPMTQNLDGRWVPSIPLPLYRLGRSQCECGRKFWTGAGYRGHYALIHILRTEE